MKFFLIVAGWCLGVGLFAQPACQYTITGRVTDENGSPLPGASVALVGTDRGQITDAEGRYRLVDLCAGDQELEARFVGFALKRINIRVAASITLNIQLEVEKQLLREVVVEQHPDHIESSQTSSILAGKALEAVQGRTLGEVMKEIAGVASIQTGPAIFKPVIHGVHSQRILILNNGIRQEGQQWGAEHAPEIDPFIASNIVVLKDASAIRYGTDALGGVVVVNPADLPASKGLGGSLHMLGSSNGRSGTISGMVEGGLKAEGWGWRVQGTGKRSGDFRAADYYLTNTGFQETNFSAAAGYHTDNKGLDVFFSHFNTTIGILRGSAVSSSEDLEQALEREPPQFTSNTFSYDINQPRQEVSHNLLKINGHWRQGNNDFRFQYGFQYNNRKEFDFRRGVLRNIPALGFKLFTHTVDAEVERIQTERLNMCVGINLMLQDNNKIDGTQTIPFIPNFTNVSGGVFWIQRYNKGPMELELGVRYDYRDYNIVGFDFSNDIYRDQINLHNFSGIFGGRYKLNDRSSITSNISTSWRPPNVAELYSLGTHQSAAAIEYGLLLDETTTEVKSLDEVNFENEQAMKWVTTYVIEGPLRLEVSGYLNYIFNYIYLRPRGVTETLRGIFPYFRYTQTDALFLGADISAHYNKLKNLEFTTKVSLLRAKDETQDDFLIWIPSNRVDLSAKYTLPGKRWRDWFAEVRVRHVARQTRAPRVVSIREINEAKEQGRDLFLEDGRNFDFLAPPPAYTLVGLAVGVSVPFEGSRLDFRASCDNLLNTEYREYTNRLRYFADDIGRNITVSAKFVF